MIKAPSLLKLYTLIYSGDPALTLPPPDEPADAEQDGAADAPAPSARERALVLARETGQWGTLITPGQTPTLFHLRPLPGTSYDWWVGEIRRRDLTVSEAAVLILRLALRKVDGFGAHVVKTRTVDGQDLATTDIIDALYAEAGAHGAAIIAELSTEVIRRSERTSPPKS
jgi:hypothetical protein